MPQRVDGQHNYGTRARGELAVSSGDHRVVGYRVPVEWRSLSEQQRGMGHGVDIGLQAKLEGGFPDGVWGFCL